MLFSPELNKGQIESRVAWLATNCPISGNDGHVLLSYYGLAKPDNSAARRKDYKDLRVLDLCSGTSDFVSRLLSRGADAYAFDYGYSDLDKFIAMAIKSPFQNRTFLSSARENPQRYIGGSVHAMPFEEGTFDAVTSFYGVFGVLDRDFDLLQMALDEGVRVLQVGGTMTIGPYLGGKDLSDLEKANQFRLSELLRKRSETVGDIQIAALSPRVGSRDIDRLGQLIVLKTAV